MNTSARSWARLGALAGGGLALAGCVVLDWVGSSDATPSFNHALHVEEGLDCLTCHLFAEEEEAPGIPVMTQCRLCHEEPEEEGEEDLLAPWFDGESYRASRHSALSDELVFSHLAHVEVGIDCAGCHGKVEEMTDLTSAVSVTMDECTACHEREGAPNECASCHSVVATDRRPRTHDSGWGIGHGMAARAECQATVDRCEMCHQESSCAQCHLTTPPRSHTNLFRRRGHAAAAALDRDRCQTCHQPDSCDQCHMETPPISHVGSWGGTRNNHCYGCHLPLSRDEGCTLCHTATPSHALAPPKPPTHSQGMDCRQCHGLGQPLSHPDNGDDCNACHM